MLRLEGLLLLRAVSIGGLGVGEDCSGSNDEVEESVSLEEGEVDEMSAGGDDPGGNEDSKGRSSSSGDKASSAVAPPDGELLVPVRKSMRFPRVGWTFDGEERAATVEPVLEVLDALDALDALDPPDDVLRAMVPGSGL